MPSSSHREAAPLRNIESSTSFRIAHVERKIEVVEHLSKLPSLSWTPYVVSS